jgi:hypothetical protein
VHCRYDDGAHARAVDEVEDLSSDWGHPSVHGHAKMAGVVWSGMFDFVDVTPPVSKASVSRRPAGKLARLIASDAAGVSGLEYKLTPPKPRKSSGVLFRRYIAPVLVGKGWTLLWRAVDVNGVSEATHSLRG